MEFSPSWSQTEVPMKNKTRPIHEVRLGAIKAAVWRNETEVGVRYNVTFSRLYKDGDTWQSTDSFGRDDLLLLSKVRTKRTPGSSRRARRRRTESVHGN